MRKLTVLWKILPRKRHHNHHFHCDSFWRVGADGAPVSEPAGVCPKDCNSNAVDRMPVRGAPSPPAELLRATGSRGNSTATSEAAAWTSVDRILETCRAAARIRGTHAQTLGTLPPLLPIHGPTIILHYIKYYRYYPLPF